MAGEDIKLGDVVQLKSGGPKMTVVDLEPTGAHCLWFYPEQQDGDAHLRKIATVALKHSEPG